MAYKPVHLVTNDDRIAISFRKYGISPECGAVCYTRQGGIHWHYLIWWPVIISPRTGRPKLQPTRETFAKHARRRLHCQYCHGRGFNGHCPTCSTLYKFIWCKNEEHHSNTARYILRKGHDSQIIVVRSYLPQEV